MSPNASPLTLAAKWSNFHTMPRDCSLILFAPRGNSAGFGCVPPSLPDSREAIRLVSDNALLSSFPSSAP